MPPSFKCVVCSEEIRCALKIKSTSLILETPGELDGISNKVSTRRNDCGTTSSSSSCTANGQRIISRWKYLCLESLNMLFGLPLNHSSLERLFPGKELDNRLCNNCLEDVSKVHQIFWELQSLERRLVQLQILIYQRLRTSQELTTGDDDATGVKKETDDGGQVGTDVNTLSFLEEINSSRKLWPRSIYTDRWKEAEDYFDKSHVIPTISISVDTEDSSHQQVPQEEGDLIDDDPLNEDPEDDPDFNALIEDANDSDWDHEAKPSRKTRQRKKSSLWTKSKSTRKSPVAQGGDTLVRFLCTADPSICNRTYGRKKDLTKHINEFHHNRTHLCDYEGCAEKFLTDGSLYWHKVRAHGMEREKKFRCLEDPDICTGKVYDTKKRLQDHIKSYHIGRSLVCDVDGCVAKFRKESILNSHKTKAHGHAERPPVRICEYCGETVINKRWNSHYRRRHLGQQHHTCDACSMVYLNSKDLENHLKLHDQVVSTFPFTCVIDECQTVFASSSELKGHVTRNHLSVWVKCPKCDVRKPNEYILKIHMRIHERENKFACDQCPKRFGMESLLKFHKREFHTENKGKYTCEVCGRGFSLQKNVVRHMKVHQDKRDFQCRICLKEFYYSCSLKKHEEIHSGTKKYACEFCGKRFTQMQNLRQHLKTQIHKDQRKEEKKEETDPSPDTDPDGNDVKVNSNIN